MLMLTVICPPEQLLNIEQNYKSEVKIVKRGANSWCEKNYKRVDQIIKVWSKYYKIIRTKTNNMTKY